MLGGAAELDAGLDTSASLGPHHPRWPAGAVFLQHPVERRLVAGSVATDGSAPCELITAAPANATVTNRNVDLAVFILEYIMHFIEMAKRAPRAANSSSGPLTRDSTEPLTVGDFFAAN